MTAPPAGAAGVRPLRIDLGLYPTRAPQESVRLGVLADALGNVSRSAVGNVIRETLPLLQREDRLPRPAPTRYRTAAHLLTAGASNTTS